MYPAREFGNRSRLSVRPARSYRPTARLIERENLGHELAERSAVAGAVAAPTFCYSGLGIDTGKLQEAAFGTTGTQQRRNGCTRFFRTAVVYAVKSLCDAPVVVTQIVHDAGDLSQHDIFDWHSVWQMRTDHDLPLLVTHISFVNSDHAAEYGDAVNSPLIQLTDLILGASRLCLERTTKKKHQVAVAEHFLPLVETPHSAAEDPPLPRSVASAQASYVVSYAHG